MNKKIFIPILVLVLLSSFASAIDVPSGGISYYNFSSPTDLWGTNDLNNRGGTPIADYPVFNISGDSSPSSFDFTPNDDIYSGAVFGTPTEFTISTHIKADNLLSNQWILAGIGSGSAGHPDVYIKPTGQIDYRGTSAEAGVNTGTSVISIDQWYHVVITANGLNRKIYLDGELKNSANQATNVVFNPSLIFARRGDATGYFNGKLDEIQIFDRELNTTEIENLYNYGSIVIPVPPPTGVNDSTESTAVVRQTGSVSFVGTTTIVSSEFQVPINNTPAYGGYVFQVSSTANNEMYCEVLIDSIPVANLTRTQTAGDLGNVVLQFETLTIRNDTGNHTQALECARTSGGGLITVSEAVAVGHFLLNEDENIIPNNSTSFNKAITSGSSYSFIDSLNITIGNQTTDDKYHSIVVEGSIEFTNNDGSDEMLAVYADINGSNCSLNPRDVGAGSSGSISYDCILENVTANQTYTINFYGNGTTANYQGFIVAKDIFLSDLEIAGGTGILLGTIFSGNTPTKLFNLTGANLNHDLANVFQKVGYSIVTDLDTTVDMYVKIINGQTYQTVNFTREFTAGVTGFLIGQDVLEDIGQDPDYQLELWANCGNVAATCEIVGGASLGYITDVTTTILNEFNITAYNAWDGSQLLTFNATNGATFSTTTGLIQFFTEEDFENITIDSAGYVSQMFMNHNTTQIINASLYQSTVTINATTITGGYPVLNFSVITNQGTFATTSGTVVITPNIDTYSWNFTADGYYNLTNIPVTITSTSQSVTITGFGDSYAIFRDANTLAPLPNNDVTLTYPDATTYPFTTNAQGAITFAGFRDGLYNIYDLTLEGTSGYVTPITFSENISVASLPSNTTYDISVTNISINIFYRTNGSVFTMPAQVVIQGVLNTSTDNGSVFIEDASIADGPYVFQVFSDGFFTEQRVITYDSQASINASFYMLEDAENYSTTITVAVRDSSQSRVANARVVLKEYTNDGLGYSQVSECYTDSEGACKFMIELDTKTYITQAFKTINGVDLSASTGSVGIIFREDVIAGESFVFSENILTITLSAVTPFSYLFNKYLEYNIEENYNNDTHLSQVTTDFLMTDGTDITVCVGYYEVTTVTKTSVLTKCVTGASGSVFPDTPVLLNSSKDYLVEVYVNQSGETTVLQPFRYNKDFSLEKMLEAGAIVQPVMLAIWVLITALALFASSIPFLGFLSIALSILETIIFPSYVVAAGTVLRILLAMQMIYVGKKKEEFQ